MANGVRETVYTFGTFRRVWLSRSLRAQETALIAARSSRPVFRAISKSSVAIDRRDERVGNFSGALN